MYNTSIISYVESLDYIGQTFYFCVLNKIVVSCLLIFCFLTLREVGSFLATRIYCNIFFVLQLFCIVNTIFEHTIIKCRFVLRKFFWKCMSILWCLSEESIFWIEFASYCSCMFFLSLNIIYCYYHHQN